MFWNILSFLFDWHFEYKWFIRWELPILSRVLVGTTDEDKKSTQLEREILLQRWSTFVFGDPKDETENAYNVGNHHVEKSVNKSIEIHVQSLHHLGIPIQRQARTSKKILSSNILVWNLCRATVFLICWIWLFVQHLLSFLVLYVFHWGKLISNHHHSLK